MQFDSSLDKVKFTCWFDLMSDVLESDWDDFSKVFVEVVFFWDLSIGLDGVVNHLVCGKGYYFLCK